MMDRKLVFRILEQPQKHSQSTVEKAIRECVSGQHGEFLQRVMLALAKNGLEEEGATPEQIEYVQTAMKERAIR